MYSAVHGLHGRVGQKGHTVSRFHNAGCPGDCCWCIARFDIFAQLALKRLIVLRVNGLCGHGVMLRTCEGDGHGIQCLLCAPVAVCHHGNRVFHFHDANHATALQHRGAVNRTQLAAENGRRLHGGVEHAWLPGVDAVSGGAVHLGRNIDAGNGFAHQRELRRLLEHGIGRRFEQRGVTGQLAISQRAPGGVMVHMAQPRAQLGFGNAQTCRCGLDQHLARCRSGNAHALLACESYGAAAASDLHVHDLGHFHRGRRGHAVEKARNADAQGRRETLDEHSVGKQVCGGRLLHLHQIPVGIQFVGGHHRQGSQDPLAHFGVRHDHSDGIVWCNSQPGSQERRLVAAQRVVGQLVFARAGSGIAEQQAAADHSGTQQKASSIHLHGILLGLQAVVDVRERMALRMRG